MFYSSSILFDVFLVWFHLRKTQRQPTIDLSQSSCNWYLRSLTKLASNYLRWHQRWWRSTLRSINVYEGFDHCDFYLIKVSHPVLKGSDIKKGWKGEWIAGESAKCFRANRGRGWECKREPVHVGSTNPHHSAPWSLERWSNKWIQILWKTENKSDVYQNPTMLFLLTPPKPPASIQSIPNWVLTPLTMQHRNCSHKWHSM